jgi:hypothetical protein
MVVGSTMDKVALTAVYMILYPTALEYTFFTHLQRTFIKTDHIRGYKTTLHNF